MLFYFKIDPEISLARVTGRGGTMEIYERIDWQKKTAALYENVMNEYRGPKGSGMKLIEVDASKSIEEIEAFIWECVKNRG